MKRTFLKRTLTFLCAMAVLATSILHPVETQAATSAKTVNNAYLTYLKKQIASCKYPENVTYQLYDFNKDGVKELVVSYQSGARATYDVYTYYKKKVVRLIKNENDIAYISGKKYIAGYGSGGSRYHSITLYQIKNGKAKKVSDYEQNGNKYTLNNKKIKASQYNSVEKSLRYKLGTFYSVKKSYTSPKKAGFSVSNTSKKYTAVKKIANGKIYYYEYKLGNEQMTTWKSATKTAKITSSTKFYSGDMTEYMKDKFKKPDDRKWIYSISKAQFTDKMKFYYGGSDYIQVKNGKVVKVAINIRIAG